MQKTNQKTKKVQNKPCNTQYQKVQETGRCRLLRCDVMRSFYILKKK